MFKRVAATALALMLAAPAMADEVICGKKWISFAPLSIITPFSTNPGIRVFLVRKADILRAHTPTMAGVDWGHLLLVPRKSDPVRSDGVYRVNKKTYLAVQACLLDQAPGTS